MVRDQKKFGKHCSRAMHQALASRRENTELKQWAKTDKET